MAPDPGLCGSCIHSRTIESDKGSKFRLCEKGLRDPAFAKYPPLPVRSCAGWVRIRAATSADLSEVQRIYAHWVLHDVASFETEPPDIEEMRRRFAQIADQRLPYLVAEADRGQARTVPDGPPTSLELDNPSPSGSVVRASSSQVAGYAYATLYRPRPAYRFTLEDSIYLDPSYLRQGIGRKLLTALLAECASRGYKQVIAVIGGGLQNSASVLLHSKCGFEHAGLLKAVGYKFDAWRDTALMQRTL